MSSHPRPPIQWLFLGCVLLHACGPGAAIYAALGPLALKLKLKDHPILVGQFNAHVRTLAWAWAWAFVAMAMVAAQLYLWSSLSFPPASSSASSLTVWGERREVHVLSEFAVQEPLGEIPQSIQNLEKYPSVRFQCAFAARWAPSVPYLRTSKSARARSTEMNDALLLMMVTELWILVTVWTGTNMRGLREVWLFRFVNSRVLCIYMQLHRGDPEPISISDIGQHGICTGYRTQPFDSSAIQQRAWLGYKAMLVIESALRILSRACAPDGLLIDTIEVWHLIHDLSFENQQENPLIYILLSKATSYFFEGDAWKVKTENRRQMVDIERSASACNNNPKTGGWVTVLCTLIPNAKIRKRSSIAKVPTLWMIKSPGSLTRPGCHDIRISAMDRKVVHMEWSEVSGRKSFPAYWEWFSGLVTFGVGVTSRRHHKVWILEFECPRRLPFFKWRLMEVRLILLQWASTICGERETGDRSPHLTKFGSITKFSLTRRRGSRQWHDAIRLSDHMLWIWLYLARSPDRFFAQWKLRDS
ncbi:hypothetical protein BDZ97DRAFT_1756242 [Flammula alnicola]|nr:hypothetical protein BDZ97DRAFT_1756242 [Flammula alnicola]